MTTRTLCSTLALASLLCITSGCFKNYQPRDSFEFFSEITEIDEYYGVTTYPDDVREFLARMSCGTMICGSGPYEVKHEWTDNQGYKNVTAARVNRLWNIQLEDGPCDLMYILEFVPPLGKIHMPCEIYTGYQGSEWTPQAVTSQAFDYSDASLTPGTDLTACCLYGSQWMGHGEFLTSPNGEYYLLLQSDGNLVLYDQDGVILWETETDGMGGQYVEMTEDGNLRILSGSFSVIWESETDGEYGWCGVDNSGHLVIYDQYSQFVVSFPS